MGAKVIIVDDDRDTREMLQVALEVNGYEVMLAANGLRLISSLHVDQPDLILLALVLIGATAGHIQATVFGFGVGFGAQTS